MRLVLLPYLAIPYLDIPYLAIPRHTMRLAR
jgi:hypothetical protein